MGEGGAEAALVLLRRHEETRQVSDAIPDDGEFSEEELNRFLPQAHPSLECGN